VPRDHYGVLGLDRDASPTEVKAAYRRLARQHHPDANQGDLAAEAEFKAVAAAYKVLSDPEGRRHYDRFGHEGPTVGMAGDPFGGINDIFESFFGGAGGFGGGGRGRSGPITGEDLETTLLVDFVDAVFGCEEELTVRPRWRAPPVRRPARRRAPRRSVARAAGGPVRSNGCDSRCWARW